MRGSLTRVAPAPTARWWSGPPRVPRTRPRVAAAVHASAALAFFAGCTHPDPIRKPPVTDEPTEIGDPCLELDLAEVPFDSSPSTRILRGDLAADFTVPLVGGAEWSLSGSWTGCDSVLVVTQQTPVHATDPQSIWSTGVARLIETSPRNARYLFVPNGVFGGAMTAATDALQADIDDALAELGAYDASWWRDRLLVSRVEAASLEGWAADLLASPRGSAGFNIDRSQRIRGLGSLRAPDLTTGGTGPDVYQTHLYTLAYEAAFNEYRYKVEHAFDDAQDLVVVPVVDGSLLPGANGATIELPDTATLATYDSLFVDLVWSCPDPNLHELDGCDAGGDLAQLVWIGPGGEDVELMRLITPRQREGRWQVDATYALPLMAAGGTQELRFDWAAPGGAAPADVQVSLVLANRGLGRVPVETVPLWTGGPVHAGFNAERPPIEVTRGADITYVDLRVISSGHGEGTSGCMARCEYSESIPSLDLRMFKTDTGLPDCPQYVGSGLVPNQAGDWWTIYAGWCSGAPIESYGSPVTENLAVDQPFAFDYELEVNGRAPEDGDYGWIELGTWVVLWR